MTIDVPERGVSVEDGQATAKPIGRRTVLAGAAWAVPAIAVATAAPAHAASGLRLAFDKTTYAAVACGILTGLQLSLLNGAQPVAGASVVVSLPSGFTFTSGGSSASGVTDGSGNYAVPPINVGVGASSSVITASSGSLVATAPVTVAPNTNALGAREANPIDRTWGSIPKGATPVGANYYLSAEGELWIEDRRVATGVIAAAGYRRLDSQFADYVLSTGRALRARYDNPQDSTLDGVPNGMRPVGCNYFLSNEGDLWWGDKPVTGNVKSVVAWNDGNSYTYADLELVTGVLVRAFDDRIAATFSPMPASAVPIGADYFLSAEGDLFFQANFVAAQVASANGWYHRNWNELYADYMTTRGEAYYAKNGRQRDWKYSNIPAGAVPVGAKYFLSSAGDLYFDSKLAIAGVDKATGWCSSGGDLYCDVRLKSGAALRMHWENIDLMLSPLPEGAVPIGASYFFDAANQELYYKGKLLVSGVVNAVGWHFVNQGDYADYVTTGGQAFRAMWDNRRERTYPAIPANATSLGCGYFLADGVLHWRESVVARNVTAAVARSDRDNTTADFQLASGASARARDERIERTYSPMPNDAAAVGADYFLTPGGELYWQGRLIATDVISATGWYFRLSGTHCSYVTRDGVGYEATDERPRELTFQAPVPFTRALTAGYYMTADGTLYWHTDRVNLQIEKLSTWADDFNTHADVRTVDGKLYRLWDSGVERTYGSMPADAVPIGVNYFLSPSGTLYFDGNVLATGVVDAIGYYDMAARRERADYRSADGLYRRTERDTAVNKTYAGVPSDSEMLGYGYFRPSAGVVWFEGSQVATGVASVGAWSDNDNFYAAYRTAGGGAFRAKGATPNERTWIAGNTPFGATLVASRFALDSAGVLWFDGQSVTTGVTRALGWYSHGDDAFYADYVKNGVVTRAKSTTPNFFPYGSTPSSSQLLSNGYFLAGTDLWYKGAVIKTGVASGAGWGNGQVSLADYRTLDLGAYHAWQANPQDQIWTTGATPLGSEPKGADYYLSADGVLTFRGTSVATGVTEAIGWMNPEVDRQFADYRDGQGRAVRADQTTVSTTVYANVPAGAASVGAGFWLTSGGDLWFGNGRVVTDVATARGWGQFAEGGGSPQLATYRSTTGAAFRARGSVARDQSWAPGLTPLGATPIGAEYFLLGNELWFRGTFVIGNVAAAIGWQNRADDGQYADYIQTDGEAYRAKATNPFDRSFTSTPLGAVPVGAGYYLGADKRLYYEGALIAQEVAAAVGWSDPPQRAAYAQIVAC